MAELSRTEMRKRLRAYTERMENLVRTVGWAVQGVIPTVDDPPGTLAWTYTIGLTRSYDHPELCITGLHPKQGQPVLNDLGKRVRDGETIQTGRRYEDVLLPVEGEQVMPVEFVVVDRERYDDWFGQAQRFYKGSRFDMLQMLWPDAEGRLPGDPDFDAKYRDAQPVLGPLADR